MGPALRLGRASCAATTTFYGGSLVMANAAGYATPGATATGQFCLGVAIVGVANPGAAGAKEVGYEVGDYEFDSGTAGDALTVANIGDQVFIIDDNTMGATNGGSTRSAGGTMVGVSINNKPIIRVGLGLS